MFLFGHLGIGERIASPWTQGLSRKWVLLGTMLPDIIDKPLYYGLSFATGKKGLELGLICGSRTFGHTVLFSLALAGVTWFKRSKITAAILIGVATHLLLDGWSEEVISSSNNHFPTVVLWPLYGWQFPPMPYKDLAHHLAFWERPLQFYSELIGLYLLSPFAYRTKRRG